MALTISCEKDGIPTCIQRKIQGQPLHMRPGGITQYNYRNQTVYFIVSPCCDMFNYLYDSRCETICAPSGGFIGRGDGKCPDFNSKATNPKPVCMDNPK
ncbi:unnamed protein product [Didymodactylos carnosus]|uniref:DUF6970 domain-containing protein n=1 Tax=Didymodactylos carnosus TaxID=1234261 RepID=A0A815TS26_9BILA|nr:unnamed protein product [Didymodactylos carnosus]CAF1510463.1 unnamed protein product [Didymodactylos carnosus]CAF3804613.1 unnamed protein product [Didymodactylos carnosus]CAF4371249.1 unnamed protein product [Didymodactylos carnosus]